jgi:hypothetical protein
LEIVLKNLFSGQEAPCTVAKIPLAKIPLQRTRKEKRQTRNKGREERERSENSASKNSASENSASENSATAQLEKPPYLEIVLKNLFSGGGAPCTVAKIPLAEIPLVKIPPAEILLVEIILTSLSADNINMDNDNNNNNISVNVDKRWYYNQLAASYGSIALALCNTMQKDSLVTNINDRDCLAALYTLLHPEHMTQEQFITDMEKAVSDKRKKVASTIKSKNKKRRKDDGDE